MAVQFLHCQDRSLKNFAGFFYVHEKKIHSLDETLPNWTSTGITSSVFLITQQDRATVNVRPNMNLIVETIDNFKRWSDHSWAGIITDETQSTLPDEVSRKLMQLHLQGIKVYQIEDFYNCLHKKNPPTCIKPDWVTYHFEFTSL